jgi:hypothetical protein
LHRQPAYVRGMSTMQGAFVWGLRKRKARTPLRLFKMKKTREIDRDRKVGMHLAGDHKPLKYSENLTKTQKAIKKPIKN